MKEYTVANDQDGNDSFTVKGNTLEESLLKALTGIGWNISEGDDEDESDFSVDDDDADELYQKEQDEEEEYRRDCKNGLYPDKWDDAN